MRNEQLKVTDSLSYCLISSCYYGLIYFRFRAAFSHSLKEGESYVRTQTHFS